MAITQKVLIERLEELLRQENKKYLQFEELVENYLTLYAKPYKKSWKKDVSYIKRNMTPYFKGWTLDEFTPPKIQRWFIKISQKTPINANRTLNCLSKMFKLAIEWEYWDKKNPCLYIKKNPESPRERFLSQIELQLLFKVLDHQPAKTHAAIWLYILTGMRKSELINLTWKQVDLKNKIIQLPVTKNGRSHKIKIPDMAVSKLKAVTKHPSNPYVFWGRYPGSHIDISKAWKKIRARACIEDVCLHDLRHTYATYLTHLGYPVKTIGYMLNHKSIRSTERYAHTDISWLEEPAEALADLMTRINIP